MTEASLAHASVPLSLVQGEPIAQRSARVLVGWLPPNDAVNQLLGRNPMPQDDLTAVNQLIANTRSAVLQRPALVTPSSQETGRFLTRSLAVPKSTPPSPTSHGGSNGST
jgi:hypothetical protein